MSQSLEVDPKSQMVTSATLSVGVDLDIDTTEANHNNVQNNHVSILIFNDILTHLKLTNHPVMKIWQNLT